MRLVHWPAWVFGKSSRPARPGARRRRAAGATLSFVEWLRPHRVRAGLPLAVACVGLARPTPATMVGGAALGAIGLAVRGAAAGHLSKNATLTTSGPYAVVRHPLYLGSLMVAAGLLVAADSWLAALLVLAYFAVFYPLAVRSEENKLARRYGSAFEEYADRVARFRPRSARAGFSTWRFSWARYRHNGEFQSALGMLAALAVLWMWMHFRIRG